MARWADQFETLAADLSRAGDRVAYEAPAVLVDQANKLAELAKARCPKVTHRLANSIWPTVDLVGLSAEVGPFAFYGAMVEFGTDHSGPQAFMGPAATEFEPGFGEAFAQLGEGVLDD